MERKEPGALIDTLASALEEPEAGWRCEFRGETVGPIEIPLILANAIQRLRAERDALKERTVLFEALHRSATQFAKLNEMAAETQDGATFGLRNAAYGDIVRTLNAIANEGET